MKACIGWFLVSGILVAANVVAAGVTLLLGQIVNSVSPNAMSTLVWPWFIAGGAGAIAAVLFFRGAMAEAGYRTNLYTRS